MHYLIPKPRPERMVAGSEMRRSRSPRATLTGCHTAFGLGFMRRASYGYDHRKSEIDSSRYASSNALSITLAETPLFRSARAMASIFGLSKSSMSTRIP